MVDEAILCSPMCSAFEALVVVCVLGHFEKNLGPFC